MTIATTLDIENHDALLTYLVDRGCIAANDPPIMTNLAGGVSNRAVLVRLPSGEEWVFKQALAKLRVKVDWFSSPERVRREAAGLRWLECLAPPGTTTPLVFEDYDNYVIAMQAVARPHENWKSMLLAGRVDPDHVRQFGSLLGAIHRNACSEDYVDAIRAEFDDRSFFESLRLEPYYAYTATQVSEAAEFIHDLIADTRACRVTLVHGDYSPKNVLVHDNLLILLDHEVVHFGDPAFDLGFSLTHLLSKAHHLPEHRAAFAKAANDYWRAYSETLGALPWRRDLEPRAVRHTLGCLLSRVAGRSTLEYMSQPELTRQRAVVVELIQDPPVTIKDLVDAFVRNL